VSQVYASGTPVKPSHVRAAFSQKVMLFTIQCDIYSLLTLILSFYVTCDTDLFAVNAVLCLLNFFILPHVTC